MNEKENVIVENEKENESTESTVKTYQEERFEFALLINDNLICKRYFKIPNYIEDSMNSMEFKNICDYLVHLIDEDLKSKSRVYTWYYYDENNQNEYDEFKNSLAEPWEYTFKFVILDNKKEMYVRIWDGYGYPKFIRSQVDITNKSIKIQDRDGRTYSYEKEAYVNNFGNRMPLEAYIQRSMIMDKDDLIKVILDTITETCSKNEENFSIKDYTMKEKYSKNVEYNLSIKKLNEEFISKLYKTYKPKNSKKK